MKVRISREEEKKGELGAYPKLKSRKGDKVLGPRKAAEALARGGMTSGALAGLISTSRGQEVVASLQAHLGNAYVQRVVGEVKRSSVRKGLPRFHVGSPGTIQSQQEEKETEEPPKLKDPKATLEKVLRDWQQTEGGKKDIALLKAAGVKKEKPEEKLILGAASILAATVANEMKVPQKAFDLIPEIELGEDVKLKIKPIWKGTLGKPPKEWGGMVTLTIKW